MSIPRKIFDDIETHMEARRFAEAWEILHPFIIDYPNNFDVLHNKAVILMNLGHVQEALSDFQAAFEIDPFYENHLYNYAMGLYLARKPEESLHMLKRVIALNPNKGIAVLNAGEVCYGLRRFKEAGEYFDRYLKLFPHKRQEMLPKLIDCLQWAEANEPDNIDVKLSLYDKLMEASGAPV